MKVHLAYVLTSIFSIFVQQVAQEVEASDLAEADYELCRSLLNNYYNSRMILKLIYCEC